MGTRKDIPMKEEPIRDIPIKFAIAGISARMQA
jgi:hypothetical protein